MDRRIVFCGGGTGGHIYPALSVARDLEERGWRSLFLGTNRKAEARIFRRVRFPHVALPAVALRKSPGGVLRFGEKLLRSLGGALSRLAAFRPAACVGLGGYGSLPGVLAARLLRVPVALFEPNAMPGRANIGLEPLAREIWTGFPGAESIFPRPSKVRRTGVPLRPELRQHGHGRERKPGSELLVLGGSQGAQGLNEMVGRMLPLLGALRERMTFAHVAGAGGEAPVRRMYRKAGFRARVAGYVHRMDAWYARAGAVLCRSGAGTLSEVAALGLPALLVPHPHSPDRHQHRNAEVLVEAGAAVVVEEAEDAHEAAARAVREMFASPQVQRRMGEAARAVGEPAAHRNVLKRIELLAERK
jgi:UDP-N-acetylglucosamine--N-acetylmuramyl-(pentapeptide) pyrophosphoryl-undecaprenol N-acetylglucosamine transferase